MYNYIYQDINAGVYRYSYIQLYIVIYLLVYLFIPQTAKYWGSQFVQRKG